MPFTTRTKYVRIWLSSNIDIIIKTFQKFNESSSSSSSLTQTKIHSTNLLIFTSVYLLPVVVDWEVNSFFTSLLYFIYHSLSWNVQLLDFVFFFAASSIVSEESKNKTKQIFLMSKKVDRGWDGLWNFINGNHDWK